MSKHLITSSPDGPDWTLPADTDLAELRQRVVNAMERETSLVVDVELGDPPAKGQLVLNGRAVTQALVIELPACE